MVVEVVAVAIVVLIENRIWNGSEHINTSYLESTQSYSGERLVKLPLSIVQYAPRGTQTVDGIVKAKQVLEQEELTDCVAEVGKFNDEIRHCQVIAVSLSTEEETVLGDCFEMSRATVVATVSL